MLYLHGGGFVFDTPRTHRTFTATLAERVQGDVLSVDYRLDPEDRVASAVADGLAAYRWLLDHGWSAQEIVIAGESAGGHLVFSVTLAALVAGLPMPAGLVSMSPFLDLTVSGESIQGNRRTDCFMPVSFLRRCALACRGGRDGLDPRLSPLFTDLMLLAGLPPTLLQVSSSEVLLSDSQRMAARLREAGVDCQLQVWEGQAHAFPLYAVPESVAAVTEIAEFVDQLTAG